MVELTVTPSGKGNDCTVLADRARQKSTYYVYRQSVCVPVVGM